MVYTGVYSFWGPPVPQPYFCLSLAPLRQPPPPSNGRLGLHKPGNTTLPDEVGPATTWARIVGQSSDGRDCGETDF